MAEMSEQVERLKIAARELVKQVQLDDTGELIGTRFVNGNGGLISPATIKKADAVRRALDAMK